MIGHGFCGIDEHERMSCREGFFAAYERGIRTMEVDFSTTSDGKIVLRHDWKSNDDMQEGVNIDNIPSLEEFLAKPLYGLYTPMSLQDLLLLLKQYPDVYLVTDSKIKETEGVTKIFQEIINEATECDCVEVLDRFIVQIYSEEMLETVQKVYPFRNYIFTLYMRWDGKDRDDYKNICKWAKAHNINGLSMWDYLSDETTRAIAFSYGLDVYVHTVNDITAAQEFLDAGVRGIYTDTITSQDVHSDVPGLIETVTKVSKND